MIRYIDRQTGKIEREKIYHEPWLHRLYSHTMIAQLLRPWLLPVIARSPLFSMLYGTIQKLPWSSHKILPFIAEFGIETSEFLESPLSFRSFNDFFIRKLKPSARPITPGSHRLIIPADGRYLFYANISRDIPFFIKGERFNLDSLLDDPILAKQYQGGSLMIARLAPSDYHRFHFPCKCEPGETRLINGNLYSVNPLALSYRPSTLWSNKRTLCRLKTTCFGDVLYIEIGATNVGSIRQTYTPGHWYEKGEEKGYFEFGGSALILLFLPTRIRFDQELLDATHRQIEMRCLLGQSMAIGCELSPDSE